MRLTLPLLVLSLTSLAAAAPATQPVTSAFYPADVVQRVRANTPPDLRRRVVAMAEPWKNMSDDQLWSLMFSANLPRSWMVWSNGFCPACKKPVPMYNWKIDAIAHPWKVQCPECQAYFPTNDFKAFYDSGLDSSGLFDPTKADRSLLYNTAHPDPTDPLHTFGVDDSTGFSDGTHRWRFIPAYLVFGQWKQAVLGGIKALATAHVLTGDETYAHKAGVLLHRLATLYPSFDFKAQGVVYEIPQADGYVSVWHDACIETRELAISYDAVKESLSRDTSLATFLSAKPPRTPLHAGAERSAAPDSSPLSPSPGTPGEGRGEGSAPRPTDSIPPSPTVQLTPTDVITHIQDGILRDPIQHAERIHSNYPQQPLTLATIHTALNWPANRAQVLAMLKPVLDQSTAFDGTTGEKGLAGYSSYAAQQLALYLGYYTRVDPHFLPDLVHQNPRLPDMYRFFILTRCLDRYYPLTGDTGYFAEPIPTYCGVLFSNDHFLGTNSHSNAVLPPSMYSFLYDLYKLTNDPAFAQTLYTSNNSTVDGLPHDLFSPDPAALRQDVQSVIDKHGPRPTLPSVNFPNWHLAILRSGTGPTARALWLDYDSWGGHGHADGMNLGLFALGLDLAPDFGYPPVQFGGWESPRANWYKSTAAHNTLLVDSANQPNGAGTCTLFASGPGFSAVSANAPALLPPSSIPQSAIRNPQSLPPTYARTLALIDTSPDSSYCLDIFRAVGGRDHIKSFSSHFSTLTTTLSDPQPATDITHAQLRNFRVTRDAAPGWSADFKIDDRYHLLPDGPKRDLHLKVIDLTNHADAYTAEAWVIAGIYDSNAEAWIPRLITRRSSASFRNPQSTIRNDEPLSSTFVSLLAPYDTTPTLQSATRLPLQSPDAKSADDDVCLSVSLPDGRRDLIVSSPRNAALTQPDTNLATDATLAHLRLSPAGRPLSLTLCHTTTFSTPTLSVRLAKPADLLQLSFPPTGGVTLLAGDPAAITSITLDGQSLTCHP